MRRARETGILSPNNQRLYHILHALKDLLPLRICAYAIVLRRAGIRDARARRNAYIYAQGAYIYPHIRIYIRAGPAYMHAQGQHICVHAEPLRMFIYAQGRDS